MDENMIAIYLYIGILLMAGTVLVLTIIYFVRAPVTRTGAINTTIEKEPGQQVTQEQPEVKTFEAKQPKAKKVYKMPFAKTKSEKTVKPVNETGKPGKKEKKLFKIRLGKVRSEKTNENVTQNTNATNKQVQSLAPKADGQQTIIANQVKKENPVSAASNIKPTAAATPVPPKSETTKTIPSVVQNTPPAVNAVKTTATAENKNPVSAENVKTANEPVKKETNPKMDNKTTTPPVNPAAVKTPATPPAAKPAAAAASTPIVKKPTEQKSSLDDMSKMFSKDAVDDTEATKLAKDMKDVEIDSLLKESQDLISILKRNRS